MGDAPDLTRIKAALDAINRAIVEIYTPALEEMARSFTALNEALRASRELAPDEESA